MTIELEKILPCSIIITLYYACKTLAHKCYTLVFEGGKFCLAASSQYNTRATHTATLDLKKNNLLSATFNMQKNSKADC